MFSGSIVALITPMNKKGSICKTSLKKLIDYHIVNGTAAIVLGGTTGESSTLSCVEHNDMVTTAVRYTNNRIPIIAAVGTSSTTETINLVKCLNYSGIHGYLVITPYYNRPTQEGLFQHFKAIAKHSNLPQILYNVPSRTNCDILPELVSRLANIKNIIGIKEATGDLSRVHRIKQLVSDEFILLSGNDATALDFMQLGGHGVISVTANVAACDMAKMCKFASKGNFKYARTINERLLLLHDKLFIESNPIPVKWACKKLGLIANDALRLPLTKLIKCNRNIVTYALKYADLL